MKKVLMLLCLPLLIISACNNEAKDSVEKADSANEVKEERGDSTGKSIIHTDEISTDFLVEAASGGMAEVQMGQLANEKASHAAVKDLGTMMVTDHTAANNQVKSLAAKRNVTLPAIPGDEEQKIMDGLSKKSGADFDRAYIKAMVSDHENDITLFEKALDGVKDLEVRTFIDNTLPTLRKHLDAAKAIQKTLK